MFGSRTRIVSQNELVEIGKQLIAMHRPITIDYAAKFGINKNVVVQQPAPVLAVQEAVAPVSFEKPKCSKCDAGSITIIYGKFGYYFKCSACSGNTPIKLGCGNKEHKERLRKEGSSFYRECSDCKSSQLYFTNNV